MRIKPTALRDTRERSGLSQSGLSRKSKVDQSHISALERDPDGANVRPETAKRIADALGVEIEVIATLTHDDTAEVSS